MNDGVFVLTFRIRYRIAFFNECGFVDRAADSRHDFRMNTMFRGVFNGAGWHGVLGELWILY